MGLKRGRKRGDRVGVVRRHRGGAKRTPQRRRVSSADRMAAADDRQCSQRRDRRGRPAGEGAGEARRSAPKHAHPSASLNETIEIVVGFRVANKDAALTRRRASRQHCG